MQYCGKEYKSANLQHLFFVVCRLKFEFLKLIFSHKFCSLISKFGRLQSYIIVLLNVISISIYLMYIFTSSLSKSFSLSSITAGRLTLVLCRLHPSTPSNFHQVDGSPSSYTASKCGRHSRTFHSQRLLVRRATWLPIVTSFYFHIIRFYKISKICKIYITMSQIIR